MIELLIYLTMILVSWVVLAGCFCSYYQHEYKVPGAYENDVIHAIYLSMLFAIAWPVGLIIGYFLTERMVHGWSFKCYESVTKE